MHRRIPVGVGAVRAVCGSQADAWRMAGGAYVRVLATMFDVFTFLKHCAALVTSVSVALSSGLSICVHQKLCIICNSKHTPRMHSHTHTHVMCVHLRAIYIHIMYKSNVAVFGVPSGSARFRSVLLSQCDYYRRFDRVLMCHPFNSAQEIAKIIHFFPARVCVSVLCLISNTLFVC